MFIIDKQKARGILTTELGYDALAADLYLRDYPQLHDELKSVVTNWLESRAVTDFEIDGVTINDVIRVRSDHFLEVVKLFNRLLDDDVLLEQRKRIVQSLLRPLIRW